MTIRKPSSPYSSVSVSQRTMSPFRMAFAHGAVLVRDSARKKWAARSMASFSAAVPPGCPGLKLPVIAPLWTIRTCASAGRSARRRVISVSVLFITARYTKKCRPRKACMQFLAFVALPGTHLGNLCVYRVEILVKLAIFESDNGFVGV